LENLPGRLPEGFATAAATSDEPAEPLSGRLEILCPRLDEAGLTRLFAGPPPPAPTSCPVEPPAEEMPRLREAGREAAEALGRMFAGSDLSVSLFADGFGTYDPRVEQTYALSQLSADLRLRDGRLVLAYDGGLAGGTVRYRGEVDLTDPKARLRRRNEQLDLQATEQIRPQFAWTFPGNQLEGSFSRIEEVSVSWPAALSSMLDWRFPLALEGTAKIVARDGVLIGRAAPRPVADIFPGLNLAEYRYETMTGFTSFLADGSQSNDLIFSGENYDIYMEGTTAPDGRAEYEIGLILLSSPQSPELNHQLRLGRVPILYTRGRICRGELLDEEVSYPWPTESLATVFFKNNLIYRMWKSAGQKP
jgi:hypothetical protein